MRPLAVIGNLAKDVVAGGPPRVGGAPYYCARALRVVGRPARILAKCAPDDRAALLPPVLELGLPVLWKPAQSTSTFSFRYDGDVRVMTIEELGDPWTRDEAQGWVIAALGGARWVHVGSLARSDFPPETLAALARGRKLSLDGQALVRRAETGPLVLDAEFDPALLRNVTILKLAEEEARAIVGEDYTRSIGGLGVPEVLVTLGLRGSIVFSGGRIDPVPAAPPREDVDPTGAGDAFSAAYLAARSAGYPAVMAAKRASTVVSTLLAHGIR